MTIQTTIMNAEAAAKSFVLGLVSDESVLQKDVADVITEVDANPVLKLGADEVYAVFKAEIAKVPALAADVTLAETFTKDILAALTGVVAKMPIAIPVTPAKA